MAGIIPQSQLKDVMVTSLAFKEYVKHRGKGRTDQTVLIDVSNLLLFGKCTGVGVRIGLKIQPMCHCFPIK